ncbi:hypothetical protein HYPSUDRAFT_200287 [Hypholoma sublateritium FD-334 SS-4]|uniref:Chromo domain-containing protein n=1 Tax=Hypholoma sublateritium (strain FD-334 SS-4) TaxID=945553 RepID=A0A0D2LBZ8_HYPSF|nr:hypothetical protein HYPSUDRAFT_200287 [Hypholoma sublateritium FD-334 SS-4]
MPTYISSFRIAEPQPCKVEAHVDSELTVDEDGITVTVTLNIIDPVDATSAANEMTVEENGAASVKEAHHDEIHPIENAKPDTLEPMDVDEEEDQHPVEEDVYYDIEGVLKRKEDNQGTQHFYVVWKNYGSEHNSWVRADMASPVLYTSSAYAQPQPWMAKVYIAGIFLSRILPNGIKEHYVAFSGCSPQEYAWVCDYYFSDAVMETHSEQFLADRASFISGQVDNVLATRLDPDVSIFIRPQTTINIDHQDNIECLVKWQHCREAENDSWVPAKL